MINPETVSYINSIPPKKTPNIEPLVDYIVQQHQSKELANLNFICTHNSRRSQLSQVLAKVIAMMNNLPHIQTHSGGTEETQVSLHALMALQRIGLPYQKDNDGQKNNPTYKVTFQKDGFSLKLFSKKYMDIKSSFYAIMTCDDADRKCPVVHNSIGRITMSYKDPKKAESSTKEQEEYQKTIDEIVANLKALFHNVHKKLHALS